MSSTETGTEATPEGMPAGPALLDVRDLTVRFPTAEGVVKAVSGLSYSVRRGETLGIVGECVDEGGGRSVGADLRIVDVANVGEQTEV